jgi:flagellar basal-body rod protein FlgF
MENPIYIGVSRQVVLRRQMDLVANNIANMNTPGYRAQNMVFGEYVTDPRGNPDPVSMVYDVGQFQVTRQGPVKVTGNPLDVALNGPGYFGVQTPEGMRYTRAGNFERNVAGELVTPEGYPVASAGGGNIIIPREAGNVKISDSGFISTNEGQIGQLMVVEFENEQSLDPVGNNVYATEEQGTPAVNTTVTQGAREGSNVQSVLEITRMIEVLRDYQAVHRSVQSEHERQRSAIQTLTKQ